MRERTIGIAFLVATVGGGLVGGLLSAYWWDFGPYDAFSILTPGETVGLYSIVGGFVGFMLIGPILAIVGVALALWAHFRGGRKDLTPPQGAESGLLVLDVTETPTFLRWWTSPRDFAAGMIWVALGAGVLAAAVVVVVLARGHAHNPKSLLSPAARERCASRGSPVTIRRLVRVARANGITLSIKEKTCLATPKERAAAALNDASNGGPSGLEISEEMERREGFVLCRVGSTGFKGMSRTVTTNKYATDTETSVSVLNVGCIVYPSDGARESAQIEQLRKALRALQPD